MSVTALITGALNSTDAADKIVAWLTGTIGWQKLDQPGAHDYVLFSTGALGDRPMTIMRIVANHYDPLPTDGINTIGCMDNVCAIGYRTWNTTTHSGTAEVDRMGPWWFTFPFTSNIPSMIQFSPEIGRTQPWNELYDTIAVAANYRFNSLFDGRSFINFSNSSISSSISNNFQSLDLTNSDQVTLAPLSAFVKPGNHAPTTNCFVVDKTTGKKYNYYYTNTPALANTWFRFDPLSGSSGSFTALADPPWGTTTPNDYSFSVWDGKDKIYVYPGFGNNFASYSINGNSWTTLTSTFSPGSVNTTYQDNVGKNRAIYLTASFNKSISSDLILWMGPSYTGGPEGNGWFVYNVNNNVWVTSSFNADRTYTTFPFSKQAYDGFMVYDPLKGVSGTLYASWYTAGGYFISSLDGSNLSGSWVLTASAGFVPQNYGWSSNTAGDVQNIRLSAGALYLPSAGVNLQLIGVGNKDYFGVVAGWNVGASSQQIFKMMYAGYPTQYFKRDKFTLQNPVSPGTNVPIFFNEAVSGKLIPYDVVEITSVSASLNPTRGVVSASRGGGEYAIVLATTGTNGVVVSQVKNSYSASDVVGVDPYGWVVGNDGCTFLTHRGANGYMGDGYADSLKLQPKLPYKFSFVGNRGAALAVPLVLFQNMPGNTSDVVGELPNIFVAPVGSQPGDYLTIGGHTYYVFFPDTLAFVRDQRPWMIGPTDV